MRGFGPDNDMDYRTWAGDPGERECVDCTEPGVVWDAWQNTWRCVDCHVEYERRREDGPDEPSYSGGASEQIASGYDALAQRRR